MIYVVDPENIMNEIVGLVPEFVGYEKEYLYDPDYNDLMLIPGSLFFDELNDQCNGAGQKYGGIDNFQALKENLTMNFIPETIFSMDIDNYDEFLTQRRLLMAKKIKDYYYSL
jgi:hypothetical protein